MATPFIAEISMFAGNFAPRGWAFCNGQIMSIAQNTALFSLIGTTYGGNGQTTFALPDLRGRVPVHPGQGPGLTHRSLGEMGGVEVSRPDVPVQRTDQGGIPVSKGGDNMQPYLAVNFIIAVEGIFPSRN